MMRVLPFVLAAALLPACVTPTHQAAEGALGPYSASVVSGRLVFLSGQVGAEAGTLADETRSALLRVRRELRRVGADLDDVVSVTVYLTDMDDYAAFNEIYAAAMPEPYPARACVAVAALPGGRRVEIQAVAVLE